jgi:hypothetical protein
LGLSCANCLNPVANPNASTNYVVTATSGACTDTAHVNVTVIQSPIAHILNANSTICAGDTIHLQGQIGPGVVSWTPTNSISCANYQ